MYEYIKGTLVSLSHEFAIIDVGGIAYRIHIPISLYTMAHKEGSELTLYISHIVREDSERLFGFLSRGERDLFEKFLGISGIGAKTALSLIGHMDSGDLKLAIQTGNATLLSRVPGIGKKTAERIIVELSDRIEKWKLETSLPTGVKGDLISDALAALTNLGYSHSHAEKAIKKVIDDNEELPQLITSALKHI